MATYIFLTTFTEQGITALDESPERTAHAREMVESLGGTWRDFFVTMGQYDGVVIADFPDEETAAQAALTLGKSGNVTTETLRAFDLEEFRGLVERVE